MVLVLLDVNLGALGLHARQLNKYRLAGLLCKLTSLREINEDKKQHLVELEPSLLLLGKTSHTGIYIYTTSNYPSTNFLPSLHILFLSYYEI